MNSLMKKGAALPRLLSFPSTFAPTRLFALFALAILGFSSGTLRQQRLHLQGLCDNIAFTSGHDFSRATTLAKATRLHPLRETLPVLRQAPDVRRLAAEKSESIPQSSSSPDFTAHEWGTFTSISAPNGRPMDWLTLAGSANLPTFVEHFRDVNFKGGLRGMIRMETPVLYFYSPSELNVSVSASFSRGLITEWFPHADSVNPYLDPHIFSLCGQNTPGSIFWSSVHIDAHGASDFPNDNSGNSYYAARETASAPLELSTPTGPQREKFLFYRGVAAFYPPLAATLGPDGSVNLQNGNSDGATAKRRNMEAEIADVILFERRGSNLGYRVLGPLRDQAALAPPSLNASLDSLQAHLENMLISEGLFPDEAHAMLETWKNSWFEEGSRLIYIVPRNFVDSVLPLRIEPAPSNLVRVYVGRLELITPATQQAVESALTTRDHSALAKYNRFLDSILCYMLQESDSDPARQKRLLSYLNSLPTNP
jgi:hypothetical protein